MKKNKFLREIKNNFYDEKKAVGLRQKVNELYFRFNLSKRKIVRKLGMSMKFVIRWTRSRKMDFTCDRRGWKKGKLRKLTMNTKARIKALHADLESNKKNYFCGATAIETEWRKRYREQPPALRTIGKLLKELGLSKGKRKKIKGASRYLCYPEHTIYHRFKGRIMEADFIGEKYLKGSSKPLHFTGFSCKQEPRLRYYQRVESQTTDEFIRSCETIFKKLERPNYLKVDNCLATIGSASGKRNISRTMNYLLSKEIIPIFAVPRKPFTQASIEGNNSVFSRKFWHRKEYDSTAQIDKELHWFNASSLRYTGYDIHLSNGEKNNQPYNAKPFIPKIYFLRQVRQNHAGGYVDVLNETIVLPNEYVNYYVLAEWNLKQQHLKIFFEKDKRPLKIHQQRFTINAGSTKRMTVLKEK